MKAKLILQKEGFSFYFTKIDGKRQIHGIKDGRQTSATPSLPVHHKTDKEYIKAVVTLIDKIPKDYWHGEKIKRNIQEFSTDITINI